MYTLPLERTERFNVIRDDFTFGGTKRIALETWLPSLNTEHVVYAGSVFGWGAPALAVACQTLKIRCTILMSTSSYEPPWLRRLEEMKTRLVMKPPTPVEFLNQEASAYKDAYLVPSGFDDPGFRTAIANRAAELPAPERAWVPVVSGTLLRSLEQAWPETEFHGVCAARRHGYTGAATLHIAPEKFSNPAEQKPPYPSCAFSDAKVWQFAVQLGQQNDLIWNTNP